MLEILNEYIIVGAYGMYMGMLVPYTTIKILNTERLMSFANNKFAQILTGGLLGVLLSVGTYKVLNKIGNMINKFTQILTGGLVGILFSVGIYKIIKKLETHIEFIIDNFIKKRILIRWM